MKIEGAGINKKEKFFGEIEKQLNFPGECNGKVARFIDWINELSWYPPEKGVCITITEYEKLLNDDLEFNNKLPTIFEQYILSFWEDGVLKYVKNGVSRKFYVILS